METSRLLLMLSVALVALAALIGALAFIALQSALKWLGTQLAWSELLWQSVRGLLLGGFVAALMPWLLVRLRLLPARLG